MSMYNHDVDAIVDQYVTRIPVSVLLIDDEFLIGEAMRIKLSSETDIIFNYCKEPDKALETAIGVQPTVIMLDLVMPSVNGQFEEKRRALAGLAFNPDPVRATKGSLLRTWIDSLPIDDCHAGPDS